MGKLILDSDLRAKLGEGKTRFEVIDESGDVVGQYLPQDEYIRLLYEIELARPPISAEEREAARKEFREGRCWTTAQVLDHLRELDDRLRGGR